MSALTWCSWCDLTVDVDKDHFDDEGHCTIQPIREALLRAANESEF